MNLDDNKVISVVSKEPNDAELFQNVLSTIEGINIVKFTDAVEALDHLKLNGKNYAVMVSDLRMPVINGIQLLKTVKDLNPYARTILVTGQETHHSLLKVYDKTRIVNKFLRKPIDLDGLFSEVNEQIKSIKQLNKKQELERT
jgi:DNA-binding NtrC family response regulator